MSFSVLTIFLNAGFSVNRFGHLACFTSDIERFLQVLDNNKKSEFLKKLLKEYEVSTSVPTKALGQSITVFKVQNLIGDVFALPVEGMPYANINLSVQQFVFYEAFGSFTNFIIVAFVLSSKN